jgi:AraC-like DNA-binding protein
MLVQKQNGEPAVISRAKEFISQHYSEDISSGRVASEVHLSKFYFCKLFKSGTGLTITAYLSRLRVERVKELLLNPNLRVSEIAFQTGFQSLTHFNRVFLNLTGQSPTRFRERLLKA